MANLAEDLRVQEIVRELQGATLGGHALLAVLPRLRSLLGAERVAAFKIVPAQGGGYEAQFIFFEGFSAGSELKFTDWLKTAPPRAFAFDTGEPQESQRNLVVRLRDLLTADQLAKLPVYRDLFPLLGLTGLDWIRLLVCDGPKLLAWVGAFRAQPFTEVETQRLQQLVPNLISRLALEATLYK